MKKVLLTSALFLSVCALSAQESVVKQAKSESDPVKAAKIIAPALKDPSTANNPETWKMAGEKLILQSCITAWLRCSSSI